MSEDNHFKVEKNATKSRSWKNYTPIIVVFVVIPILILAGLNTGTKARKMVATYSESNKISPLTEPIIDSLPPVILKGQSYKVIVIDSLIWMAENLNYDIGEGSLCFENDTANCLKYGRLYTFDVAIKACKELGWRLPTKEEWEALKAGFGDGNHAYNSLLKDGKTGFDAVLGGGHSFYDDKVEKPGIIGSYWSSTEFKEGDDFAWKFAFRTNKRGLKFISRDLNGKKWALSCRCVKPIPSTSNSENENTTMD